MSETQNTSQPELTFQFFRDESGRLRCRCLQLGLTRPVEKADGTKKRYKFGKVMGLPVTQWFGQDEVLRLQTAKEGDIIILTVKGHVTNLHRLEPNQEPRRHYILNSAVITSPGTYEYCLMSIEDAKKWLVDNPMCESAIGYPETAQALQLITGIEIPVNRKQIIMQVGDEALVFRLTKRLDDAKLKGNVSIQGIINNSEMGMIVRIK